MANTVTVINIETVAGGAGDDIVTLGAAITGGLVDLGDGSDKLILANAATNTITIANIETMVGGTGNDVITLSATITGGVSIWVRAMIS